MKFKPVFENIPRPILIAGPCSAESETQVVETAKELAKFGVNLFRAGIWKPRTRPGAFEGIGTEGLRWLKRVKEETGMLVTTEVANTQHVFEALKYGIDVLWIGARTTVNPFSVQEIADALKGTNIPVLVKNPVNPDVSLWIGALERLHKAGIERIGAIHRGFSYHGESNYRNVPRWQLTIELKRQFPEIQIICDHSHICGRRDTLAKVAQWALDLDYDGLMTEVHPEPDKAWSDASQQITPLQYSQMIEHLVARMSTTDNPGFLLPLSNLRSQIDELDDEILQLLGTRMGLADKIGQYKMENNIAILQPTRWNDILEHAFDKGARLGLSKKFIEVVLKSIHQESIEHQAAIMNRNMVNDDVTLSNGEV
jgi:chorismate mutase